MSSKASMLLFWVQEEEAIALVEAMLDANALELLVQVHRAFTPTPQLHGADMLSQSLSRCADSTSPCSCDAAAHIAG